MARRSFRIEIRHRCHDRDVVRVHGDDELCMVAGLAHRYPARLRSHRRRFSRGELQGPGRAVRQARPPEAGGLADLVKLCGKHAGAADHGPTHHRIGMAVRLRGDRVCRHSLRSRLCCAGPARSSRGRIRYRACVNRGTRADGKGTDAAIVEGSVPLAVDDGLVRPELCQQGAGFLDADLPAAAGSI